MGFWHSFGNSYSAEFNEVTHEQSWHASEQSWRLVFSENDFTWLQLTSAVSFGTTA
jgi:hypothetical protein